MMNRHFGDIFLRIAVVFVLIAAVGFAGAPAVYAADDVLTVRARQGQDIHTMDPAHYLGNEEYNVDLAIFSKLVQFEPGTPELRLDAAESLEVSDDGLVIEFKLREGIQFHFGYGEMTAEDVKFSFERIADPETNSAYRADWAPLDKVEVTGRYTGRIILTEAFAPLMVSTLPWSPGSIMSKAAFEDRGERIATQPVGSGPYYWSEWQPNQRVVLERFDDYYGEQPDFRQIVIRPLTEHQVAELAFDRGELDMTEISLDMLPVYEADPNTDLEVLATLRYHWFGFNMEHPPFDDIKVREAVREAIDVDQILAGAYNNVPPRANAMIPESILGHWADAPHREPNIERAKQMLAEAGYPDGFSTELHTTNVPDHLQGSAIVQQQLRQIGIDANIRIYEASLPNLGEQSPPGVHYISLSAILDPGYWFEWFTCEQVGQWNFWKWCSPEFDELKDLAAVTMEPEERADIYVRMQQLMDEDVGAIWITNGASVQAVKPDVQPYFLAQYAQYPYFKRND